MGVPLPGYHPEVVNGDVPVDAPDQGLHPLAGLLGDAVVGAHRVHVNYRLAAQALPELPLHMVNAVVELQQFSAGRDLGVEGDHPPPGAVIVDDEVVDPQDRLVGQDQGPDFLHKLRRGRRAQQGVHGGLNRLDAGPEDEQGHQQSPPSVQSHARIPLHQGGGQHHRRGGAVAEGVQGGGLHGGGADALSDPPVVKGHVELYRDGGAEDRRHPGAGLRRDRVQNLPHGGLGQLEAHQQDQHGHHQAGEVLHPPVAEGVLVVRLLLRQAKAQQGDHGGPGVGKVVHGVRHYGDGPGGQARQQLSQKQQQI